MKKLFLAIALSSLLSGMQYAMEVNTVKIPPILLAAQISLTDQDKQIYQLVKQLIKHKQNCSNFHCLRCRRPIKVTKNSSFTGKEIFYGDNLRRHLLSDKCQQAKNSYEDEGLLSLKFALLEEALRRDFEDIQFDNAAQIIAGFKNAHVDENRMDIQ